jgi:hypothetical protein
MVNELSARKCAGCGYDLISAPAGGDSGNSWLSGFFGLFSRQRPATPTPTAATPTGRCPYCRAVNSPQAATCIGCGHPLNVPLQAQYRRPRQPFSERFKSYVTAHWQGFATAAVFIGGATFLLWASSSEKNQEQERKARCTSQARGKLNPKYQIITKTTSIKFIPVSSKTTYDVTYTFQVNGATLTGKSNWAFEPTQLDVQVHYEPENPSNNYADPFNN